MPVCRNWQTTATQNRVEKSVWVRVPPPAPENPERDSVRDFFCRIEIELLEGEGIVEAAKRSGTYFAIVM